MWRLPTVAPGVSWPRLLVAAENTSQQLSFSVVDSEAVFGAMLMGKLNALKPSATRGSISPAYESPPCLANMA